MKCKMESFVKALNFPIMSIYVKGRPWRLSDLRHYPSNPRCLTGMDSTPVDYTLDRVVFCTRATCNGIVD